MGCFWLLSVQGQSEVIQCIFELSYLQQPCTSISKMARRRAKQTQIWAWGVLNLCIWATFDLQVFKVSPRSFSRFATDFSDFQQPCIMKTADRWVKRTNIWESGVCTCLVYTWYVGLISVLGHSEIIWCISDFWQPYNHTPCISKQLVVEWYGCNLSIGVTI